MVWTIMKPDSKRLNKDTRWDRIRKRHGCNLNMKSILAKKLVEMDFIGKNNMKLMNGDVDVKLNLSPLLVMDLRHEMKSRKYSPLRAKPYKANIDKCIVHNMEVEERYILNELSKFRTQLEKNRRQYKIKPKLLDNDHFRLNNKSILRSLENTTRHIEDFYEAPVQAIKQLNDARTVEDNLKENEINDEQNGDFLSQKNYQRENIEMRCVRFEESIDVVKYNREESTCSNTSNGIDSVISDLAEEALNQIEMENVFEEDAFIIQIEGTALGNNLTNPLVVTQILPAQLDRVQSQLSLANSSDEGEESISNEQTAIVEQLFQTRAHSNCVILKNYFLKWVHFTTIQKIERQNVVGRNDRIHKINAFLDNIRREKKTQIAEANSKPSGETKIQNINITKKYQSKIKIQQDIIDLQRMKLERQERLITELKLNKLSEEAKEARADIKTELKNAFRNGDSKSRAKVKCLQIMGNLRDEEDDEFARLQGKALIQPKFLTSMQERALIRSVKHEQAKQRRLQQDAEREAAKMAIEEAKRHEDEEAKRMRIELLKEKRRQEKMAKVLKEREHQRYIENNKMAQQFSRLYLLRRVGMEAFKKILQAKKANQRKSEAFKVKLAKKNTFNAWKRLYLFIRERKLAFAIDLHEKILKRTAMKAWLSYLQGERSKYLVAVDWYELKLSQAVFTQWCGYTKLQKLIEDMKMNQAESHHEWHLKWKVVDRWQRLPHIIKLEKETDERRQRWRMKIWELLPDYTPNRDHIF